MYLITITSWNAKLFPPFILKVNWIFSSKELRLFTILAGKTNANMLSTNHFQFCTKFLNEGIIVVYSSVINMFAGTGPNGDPIGTESTCMYILLL